MTHDQSNNINNFNSVAHGKATVFTGNDSGIAHNMAIVLILEYRYKPQFTAKTINN